jgi:hypothetical protein
MILPSLGKLSVAQDITASDEDSTNVIQVAAVDWAAMTDLWWVVQTTTIAAGDSADTFDFSLVMSQETTLDTNKTVAMVSITGIADKRLATIGRFIAAFNIGKQMKQMIEEDASDYPYIGQLNVLSAGATVSINSNLSFTEPHTVVHRQVVDSNIDNSIAVASVGSGA